MARKASLGGFPSLRQWTGRAYLKVIIEPVTVESEAGGGAVGADGATISTSLTFQENPPLMAPIFCETIRAAAEATAGSYFCSARAGGASTPSAIIAAKTGFIFRPLSGAKLCDAL